jgi:hypothetical protein
MTINDIEDLQEIWDTPRHMFGPAGKIHLEALDLIVKFKKYRAFNSGAIKEFYSPLRSAMLGARKAGLLQHLFNDQTLPSILARIPMGDWKQWAKERPTWIGGPVEDAFWAFIDQKWKDSLKVAAAEPAGWDQGGGYSRGVGTIKRKSKTNKGSREHQLPGSMWPWPAAAR